MASRDFWDRSADVLLVLAYAAALVIALLVVGWQVLHWLRLGEWHPLPFLALFEYLGWDLSRVYAPSSWVGLAKVFQLVLAVPLAIAMPIVVVVTAHLWRSFVSSGTAPPSSEPRIR